MAVLGMRGSGSFAAAERPKNWRQGILMLFPNGDAPLTAILSKLRETPTDDPEFAWFEKGLPEQRYMITRAQSDTTGVGVVPVLDADVAANNGSVSTGLYVGLVMRPLTGPAGTAGTVADHSAIKPGHLLYDQTIDETFLVVKHLTAATPVSGVSDYLIVKRNIGGKYTLGTNNPAITGDLTAGDTVVISGSGFPEGGPIGEAVAYQPLKHYNYTQIFRTALEMTRTGRKTRLRWDSSGGYAEAKREALQLHAIEMERAFLFGERSEQTSIASGQVDDASLTGASSNAPLRTTRGMLNWLPTITSAATPTIHWDIGTANGGALTEALWDQYLEEAFRFGSKEKLALCGSTFMTVLTQLAKNKATIEMVPTDQAYGMALMRYLTPFGSLMLMSHPLMSHDPVWRKDVFILDVDKLNFRYIDDTTFLKNRQAPGDDSSVDEWLTEAGMEVHFSGVTADNRDGLAATAGPAAHGRLKGVASYGG